MHEKANLALVFNTVIFPYCTTDKNLSKKKKADDRTRTDNLLITSQLLCQLSHIGVTRAEYKKYIIILSTFRQVFFIKILYFQKKCVRARRISRR